MSAIALPVLKTFEQSDELVAVLAQRIADALQAAVDSRGQASLVVSGGSTPVPLFHKLRTMPIDWQEVYITLADERWLPADHADSNERLVREHLLVGNAAKAKFRGMYNIHGTPEAGAAMTAETLSNLPRPFDVVILGMGNDGHTASLFPCSEELQAGLTTEAVCLAVRPTTAPHPRLSLSLHSLLNARQIYLHLSGESKKAVLDEALSSKDVMAMPIRAVLDQRKVPVDVYWSKA
ncbi:6-phosphogluconolactonase [Ferrimonas balearica DSM 9799]|uniref:6-phosphogluconolactonase n=1 Tax=Ferrimonas balearica (strain DSM 9799 / CCM 4581 / KCTC 23876 / PAT) TaxID=550540 RepID=E1STQ4_FERBD|nr:6-phosphogluconolactonase [Ferrimonas balearica]ADN76167.1 6-phosphogluconolactonase [Ferrimonas balearica DSM 9799]MBY5981028.1 6-phosphogluconolactonase [Ferrimonas balearica]MBY6095055.1 6-phosphogluconolactonase [Ferrimonas balearica]